MQKHLYTAPAIALILSSGEDILKASDEFELMPDWFGSRNAAYSAPEDGGSDAPVA